MGAVLLRVVGLIRRMRGGGGGVEWGVLIRYVGTGGCGRRPESSSDLVVRQCGEVAGRMGRSDESVTVGCGPDVWELVYGRD